MITDVSSHCFFLFVSLFLWLSLCCFLFCFFEGKGVLGAVQTTTVIWRIATFKTRRNAYPTGKVSENTEAFSKQLFATYHRKKKKRKKFRVQSVKISKINSSGCDFPTFLSLFSWIIDVKSLSATYDEKKKALEENDTYIQVGFFFSSS